MSASGGTKAIIAALLANAGIALAKFVGYLVTGSSSMLAEAVHSVADTSNQGLLLLGGKRATARRDGRAPVRLRPRPVLLLLRRRAAAVQPRLGVRDLRGHPQARERGAAHLADGRGDHPGGGDRAGGLLVPHRDRRVAPAQGPPRPGGSSSASPRRPELPVVLLEDFGALIGLVLALLGVGLTRADRQPGVRRARHDRDRRPARRHRGHPDRRDEEPADRRGRQRAGARAHRRGDRGAATRSSASSTSARSTSGRRSSSSRPRSRWSRCMHDRGRRARRSTRPSSGSATRCRRPG